MSGIINFPFSFPSPPMNKQRGEDRRGVLLQIWVGECLPHVQRLGLPNRNSCSNGVLVGGEGEEEPGEGKILVGEERGALFTCWVGANSNHCGIATAVTLSHPPHSFMGGGVLCGQLWKDASLFTLDS